MGLIEEARLVRKKLKSLREMLEAVRKKISSGFANAAEYLKLVAEVEEEEKNFQKKVNDAAIQALKGSKEKRKRLLEALILVKISEKENTREKFEKFEKYCQKQINDFSLQIKQIIEQNLLGRDHAVMSLESVAEAGAIIRQNEAIAKMKRWEIKLLSHSLARKEKLAAAVETLAQLLSI